VGEATGPPPVEWIAVLLTLVLAAGGLLAFRGRGRVAPVPRDDRQALLVRLARLDEDFEREPSTSAAATREYRRRRAELLERIKNN
jgi:hypothetical protein